MEAFSKSQEFGVWRKEADEACVRSGNQVPKSCQMRKFDSILWEQGDLAPNIHTPYS